jgi:hypothetical protein
MTGDADAHDADATGESPPAGGKPGDLSDIDAVMANFARRMEELRLDLDRIARNLDAIGQ